MHEYMCSYIKAIMADKLNYSITYSIGDWRNYAQVIYSQ